jgi:predicted ArsR family transcriptional regulator
MTSPGDEMKIPPLSRVRRRILELVRANPTLTPRDVAAKVGVHVQTVRRAYRWLAKNGYGTLRPGEPGRGNAAEFCPF